MNRACFKSYFNFILIYDLYKFFFFNFPLYNYCLVLRLLFNYIILHRCCMNMGYPVSTTVAPTTQEISKPFKRLEPLNVTTTTVRKYDCMTFIFCTISGL